MVLHEVYDVVVQFPHVRDFRHQHVVAPPQPLVILRQRRGRGGGVAADAVVGCEGRRVGPLVGGIGRRGAELGWVIIESGAEGRGGMGVLVVVVRGDLRGARGFPPVDLAEQLFFPLLEELVCEFPPVWHNLSETLCLKEQKSANMI